MAGDEHMSDEQIDEVDEKMRATLAALGVNLDTVDGRTMGQLRKVERAIRDEAEARRRAEEEVRRHNLSVSSVAKASGVSHATFYNKSLLKRYVNARKEEEVPRTREGRDVALERRLEEAQAEIALMNEQGALMVQLQIENDRLKRRVRMLEVQLQGGQPAMDGKGEVLLFPT
ncbi:MAG: hypothetical protein IKF14_06795 [Atopobiaceae bacterium]|nr:hypothetical protein [Atopobiaceae bacterium]